ncbi:MAG: 16S rRNA pseudouridine(516) synthase RsuA [Cocleimonas sp.]|nr:16S rRNA pseudouridine(516) synthase RsuA [Cocleimonas sp.]
MRLDKLISNSTSFTRSQAKFAIRGGKVKIDGVVAKNAAQQVTEESNVEYMGVAVNKVQPRYIMFNKPTGVVCANKDKDHTTVFDSLFLPRQDTLHVAGRLDIDTTGLVLITDDGQWLHRITSPKHNHKKVYLVELDSPITDNQIRILNEGVQLKKEKKRSLPAEIEVIEDQKIRMTISEGKYHQVKRMLAAVGNHVVTLHREKIAHIELDETLAEGEWRELTSAELELQVM